MYLVVTFHAVLGVGQSIIAAGGTKFSDIGLPHSADGA
jgi:hypothetical protein